MTFIHERHCSCSQDRSIGVRVKWVMFEGRVKGRAKAGCEGGGRKVRARPLGKRDV